MEHLVDLDVLAARLQPLLDEWKRSADVTPLTWRDEMAAWPQPITSDRSRILIPESVGIRMRRGPNDEFEMVVWTGGWADVGYLAAGEVQNFCPEFHNADGAYSAVLKEVENFLG